MTLVQELRNRMIKQIRDKAEFRKKVLKIEKIYFNQNIDGIESFQMLPINSNGTIIPFSIIKGHALRKMLKSIESGDIYGWIEYKGSRCKIKPKKIVK